MNPQVLLSVRQDFHKYISIFETANHELKTRNISQYPIFIFSIEAVEEFVSLLNKQTHHINWHIYFSYLENLVQKRLLDEDKLGGLKSRFLEAYDNNEICILILEEKSASIVFIPCLESD